MRRVVVARVELEPRRRTGFVEDPEAPVQARLPHADHRAADVDDDRHAPELHDVHRRHHHLPAVLDRTRDGRVGVGGGEVDRPQVGHAGGAVVAHAPGDVDPLGQEVHVPAVVLTGILDRPAEQPTVEVAAAVGIGGQQVDPARGTDGGVVTFRHGGSFVGSPRVRERSPGTTAPGRGTHRAGQPTGSRITTGITRSVFVS